MEPRNEPRIDISEKAIALAFLRRTSLPDVEQYWTEQGPEPRAFDVVEGKWKALPSSHAVLVRIAVDVYNGCGGATVASVVHVLDAGNLCALCELLLAIASDEEHRRWFVANALRSPLRALALVP